MSLFFAQPYSPDATGFYFESVEEFDAHVTGCRDRFGQPVEEFEIQFIDGDDINCALCRTLEVSQATLPHVIAACKHWDDSEKLCVIVAVGECGYDFDPARDRPADLDVDIFEADSMEDFARECLDEGLFGEIPDSLRFYIDIEAVSRDLSFDYGEITIGGRHYIYRCG